MKNVIMGTAGHIDHGKTTLVKLLTGIDCDTHPEEKLRGITMNLGFAHMELNDLNLGIIDVPGHKDFIDTMISGVFGVGIVMLVISAESGVMPQTVEHLRIMQMLGVRRGFVALTKTDLTEKEIQMLAILEIRELIKGTFLEGCDIVPVSSRTGKGLDELKETIYRTAVSAEEKQSGFFFRMFIDRIFSVKGFGTVVTGTSLGGRLKNETAVYLMPGEKKLRVRRIERHGEPVETVDAGSRVSLNLAGLERNDFKRGMIISEKIIAPTVMIDARMSLTNKTKFSGLWLNAVFLSGTYNSSARIHLIDKDILEIGQEAIVQINLKDPAMLMRGDKFVIRSFSGEATLGGGEIIDAYPLHHRRRPQKLVGQLQKLSAGGIVEFISHELNKNRLILKLSYFSDILSLGENMLCEIISRSLPKEIMFIKRSDQYYLLNKDKALFFEKKILQVLVNYHRKNPLDECGKTKEELLYLLKQYECSDSPAFMEIVLDELLKNGSVRAEANTYVLSGHKVVIIASLKKEIEFVENYYRNSCMRVPVPTEVSAEMEKNGISQEKYKQIMNLLMSKKKVCCISGNYIYSDIVDTCKMKLLHYLYVSNKPVTVAEFRDITNGNRKMCLLLLSYFDGQGLTLRDGDYRTITEKGKAYLERNNYE